MACNLCALRKSEYHKCIFADCPNKSDIKPMKKSTHGGARKKAGRKPLKDKKLTVSLYILESKIKQYGGLEGIKLHLYNSIA